jgi:acetolactate synthase-1/2/3 large subunit
MKRTGAQIIWESLIAEGVEVVFGYPGGTIMPAYDALLDYPSVHHVLVRHEENAAFAAGGYARASGRVGVCMSTSGPGATNLITGLADAMLDSVSMVAITGQVSSAFVGSDAFQETDVTGVTLPVTKHNYLVKDVSELAQVLKEAFYIARSGRPGPVLIDVCDQGASPWLPTEDARGRSTDPAGSRVHQQRQAPRHPGRSRHHPQRCAR